MSAQQHLNKLTGSETAGKQRPKYDEGGCTGKGFKKGQSGNPGGRPKGRVGFSTFLNRYLDRHPERLREIMQALWTVALDDTHKDWWKAVELIVKIRNEGSPLDPDAPAIPPSDSYATADEDPSGREASPIRFTFRIGDKKVNGGE